VSIGPWIAKPDRDDLDDAGGRVPARTPRVNITLEMPRGLQDLRVLAGYSDAIIVGTVTAAQATTDRDGVRWTAFSVDVLSTLKGEVPSPTVVDIIGGFDASGTLYIPYSDSATLVGSTYILWLRKAPPGQPFSWQCVPIDNAHVGMSRRAADMVKAGKADELNSIQVIKDSIAQQLPLPPRLDIDGLTGCRPVASRASRT
jgi:hypothetical protein